MPDLPFLALTIVAIASSVIALEADELIYGAAALAISFLAMAGFFVLLDAPFLALFQITVYVGAVAVLILFVVMLVRRERWMQIKERTGRGAGVLGGSVLAVTFALVAVLSGLPSWRPREEFGLSFVEMGAQILREQWLTLEILAIVLAVALIGALTLAKVER